MCKHSVSPLTTACFTELVLFFALASNFRHYHSLRFPPRPGPAPPPASLPTSSGVGVGPFGAVGYTPAVSTGGRPVSYNVGLPTPEADVAGVS